jgi:Zn-dependent peptidase ImmA (M78 family)
MSFLSDDKKEMLNKFVKFVKSELKLDSVPTISIQNGRNGLKTTANYDYTKENKIVKVNGKNRALVDVMRSVAHELVHHKQNMNGEELNGDTGSDCENEANATAGQIIRLYGQKNPNFYE